MKRTRPDAPGESPDFTCRFCGRSVAGQAPGTRFRNHCPWCLSSVHRDEAPGDRQAACGGIMDPIAIAVRQGKEWTIIHRCRACGTLRENRAAGDDSELALLSLAVRPVAAPPFPLELLHDHFGQPEPGERGGG